MANEAVTQPSMTTVLENVERDLNGGDSNITKYAPPKHRIGMPGNGELERIQANLRKSTSEILEHLHQLQLYLDNTKTTMETLLRSFG
jgi:hypothetical protein